MDAAAANAVASLILGNSDPSERPGPKPGPSTALDLWVMSHLNAVSRDPTWFRYRAITLVFASPHW
jgi:hypothetical protein